LPPDLPAVDFVRHIAEIHGLSRDDAVGRASDALWFVGLGEERLRPLGTLSTGQRQRAKLAMAIAHDPDLVLLDEPTDGLDPSQRDTMLELIGRLASDFGLSVVLSSHLLDEVERTCQSVVILNEGRIAASGSIDSLRGEDHGVSIEVDHGVDELVAALTAWGVEVSIEGPAVVVGIAEHMEGWTQDHLLWVTRDVVADLGLPLRRLATRRASLEDVFLAVGS
jgi:ABC-2 type transport system ATP-binding protein